MQGKSWKQPPRFFGIMGIVDPEVSARFDRIESAMEYLVNSQKQLLKSQVLLTDNVEKIGARLDTLTGIVENLVDGQRQADAKYLELAGNLNRLTLRNIETTDKLNTLIHVVDELLRGRPKDPSAN